MEKIKHEAFFKEMNSRGLKDEFYAAIKKEPEDFTDLDIRALIKRMGFLSDEERYKYRNILVLENLTPAEINRYQKIYPERTGGGLFGQFFPKQADVEEHYRVNFIAGRE